MPRQVERRSDKRYVNGHERPFDFEIKGFISDLPRKKNTKFIALWICFGVAIGCGIGVAMGKLALGIGPGAAIGFAIGTLILKSRH